MTIWTEILESPAEEIARRIVPDDERTRALRQCTPFAGALDPRVRRQVWEDVRRRLETA